MASPIRSGDATVWPMRDAHARLDEMLDEGQRAQHFRCERDEAGRTGRRRRPDAVGKSSRRACTMCARGWAPRVPSSGERPVAFPCGSRRSRHAEDEPQHACVLRESWSNDDVMSVGRQRVTPVSRIRSSAAGVAIRRLLPGAIEIDSGEAVHEG